MQSFQKNVTCVVVRGDCKILSRVLRMSSTRTQAGPKRWCNRWAMLNKVRSACTFFGVRTTPSEASEGRPRDPLLEAPLAVLVVLSRSAAHTPTCCLLPGIVTGWWLLPQAYISCRTLLGKADDRNQETGHHDHVGIVRPQCSLQRPCQDLQQTPQENSIVEVRMIF